MDPSRIPIFISDRHERESERWSRLWPAPAICRIEQLVNPVRLGFPSSNLQQRPDHASNLTRQERVTDNVDFERLPVVITTGSAPDKRPENPPNGSSLSQIGRPRHPFAEPGKACEIVLPFETNRSVQHPHHVERAIYLQRLGSQQRLPGTNPDPVPVVPPLRGSPRIESGWHAFDLENREVVREMAVQRPQQFLISEIRPEVHYRSNLPKRVDTGIGSARNRHPHRSISEPGEGNLKLFLDCSLARLALRAGKLLSLVRDGELQPAPVRLLVAHVRYIN